MDAGEDRQTSKYVGPLHSSYQSTPKTETWRSSLTEHTPLWCRWMLRKIVKTAKNGSLYLNFKEWVLVLKTSKDTNYTYTYVTSSRTVQEVILQQTETIHLCMYICIYRYTRVIEYVTVWTMSPLGMERLLSEDIWFVTCHCQLASYSYDSDNYHLLLVWQQLAR